MFTQYKTEIVTLSKKIPVHAASVKGDTLVEETQEKTDAFNNEFKRRKSSNDKENEIRDELLTLARKLKVDWFPIPLCVIV